MYLIPVALLVFFCYHLDAEGSKGDYTQVRKDNYEDLGYSGIVEFVNGKNDVSLKLTTANADKTSDLAIRLTDKAGGVLSFSVEYGVKAACLNTTTTKFHFGEQFGYWTGDSKYFRVMMMQGTVDPVVPFKLGKELQITIKPSTSVLKVSCGGEHT